jgi:hypothetical protein
MLTFITAARDQQSSVLELAIVSIVACYSLYGSASAEDAQPVPNYKELIYSTVKSSFIDPSSVGQVEISPLHPARPPQLGDWMALRVITNARSERIVASK